MKKEARLYEKLDKKKVKCNVCAHRCIIKEGQRGFCTTRKNINGTLYTLVYGSLISKGSIDPIEKKPLYNFWPGYSIYSVATIGCNFRCKHCQNWSISQCYPNEEGSKAICEDGGYRGRNYSLVEMSPEQLVKKVKNADCNLIAYTYNEPLIWHEYIIDVAKLAKKDGIKNVLVTNGYSTPEASEEIVKVMDAANIDIKAFTDKFYKKIISVPKLQPVLDTAIYWKEHGLHIELTNLIIPEENDDASEIRDMCKWIHENMGGLTPIHFSAYHPDYKLTNHGRTPATTLEKAYDIAEEEGLKYIYIGNLRASKGNDTFCPNCNNLLIERYGYRIKQVNLTEDNKCPKCGADTQVIGKYRMRNGFLS
ncbi:MAG: AmmeMemoRadiSam system radical SAM enzyme [Candidatus Lokiarchaeota archaeon]|nr:AmmeMemoRadiSam system radical SAM enzyme [Candidatus Lokiarchaeota archaeon]